MLTVTRIMIKISSPYDAKSEKWVFDT